jgi:hypothetical protein
VKVRLAVGAVLSLPLFWLTLVGLFFFFSGVEGLDGVGTWDGSCFEVTAGEAWLAILIGATIPSGLWAALAGWVAGKRWWRGGLLLTAVGVVLVATTALVPDANDAMAHDIVGPRCVQEQGS